VSVGLAVGDKVGRLVGEDVGAGGMVTINVADALQLVMGPMVVWAQME